MDKQTLNIPYKIITWKDKADTGAVGWIVIHNSINDVSGGGLFMHESASLQEVKDLAYTMSLKNSLQRPIFGGGKGGIKFNPQDPRAKSVLRRFLKDNSQIIKLEWCTGGDLNTSTKDITAYLSEISDIKSPFICLANMLYRNIGINVEIEKFHRNIQASENIFFSVEEAITGFSIFKIIEAKVNNAKAKIIVQGFGKVGRAFCYYAQEKYEIIGICEKDWFVYDQNGINILKLLRLDLENNFSALQLFNPVYRKKDETNEDFLIQCLSFLRADIFCPCAVRYSITEKVLNTLISQTFTESILKNFFIIAGANDIFKAKNLIQIAFENNITVIPEWLSNAGAAILFMEALKYKGNTSDWGKFVKQQVVERIYGFLNQATIIAHTHGFNIYEACSYLACTTIKKACVEQNKHFIYA